MYILLLILHVIACVVLITVVLLQAGRGGGFSDMMGGGQPQSLFGTQTNQFMTRATEVCAVLFIITSLSLGILSSQRGKSLMETGAAKRTFPVSAPAVVESVKPAVVEVPAAPVAEPAAPAVPAPASGGNAA